MIETRPGGILFLYSSNIRPLYEQDILDLIAAPSGSFYQFRYQGEYLTPELRDLWASEDLVGKRALVHFSLQQDAKYHDPAFVPVRTGFVVESRIMGDIFVLQFRLDDCLTLPAPPPDDRGGSDMAFWVREYSSFLEARGIPRPYEFSAGLGEDIISDPNAPLDREAEGVASFQRVATYLHRTKSFQGAKFMRFLSLAESKAEREQAVDILADPKDGVFELIGGRTYDLTLLHSQPAEVTGIHPFEVIADEELIRVIGRRGFDIASRYDVVTIHLHAMQPVSSEERETTVAVQPAAEGAGPRLRLGLRVVSPIGRTVGTIVFTTIGLVLVGLPALVEMPAVLRVITVGAGGLLASTLAVLGLRR